MGDVSGGTNDRCFVLGAGAGWHADQLRAAASELGVGVRFANYESLRMTVDPADGPGCGVTVDADTRPVPTAQAGQNRGLEASPLRRDDRILVRTMPPGTLEQTTFRLACLHHLVRSGTSVTNAPAGLELAIDKNATLAMANDLGISVPPTLSTISRGEALDAFDRWGCDCVVKPLFGGEGKGVMRLQDRELARTVFATLQTLGSVIHVQRFLPPGGRDQRLLIIGDHAYALRRQNDADFRTNRRFAESGTHDIKRVEVDSKLLADSRRICHAMGLVVAAVDWIDDGDHHVRLIEVNAIPGWHAAQTVIQDSIARRILQTTMQGVTS